MRTSAQSRIQARSRRPFAARYHVLTFSSDRRRDPKPPVYGLVSLYLRNAIASVKTCRANIQTVEDMYQLIWTATACKRPIEAVYKGLRQRVASVVLSPSIGPK
jgi:hypothetical protein